ncbi:MAG: Asp-tRNA(Asn)/Glu-tRNA(Gln) amidotransferase subunit GatB [Candidatus Schekmanbacteria bacterium]|nr:MAG: Asp-tRNA(Asn)/Glu-tRNA(Gln) amidotransferase subunit GatB [Candidatus Schekmanbacteria bacterium]
MNYEAVIGLEVHAQLLTKSKIFCSCSTQFGSEPNTQTCPVCLGMPGVLPVANREVINMAIKTSLALNCKINNYGRFARKNYFYPDLPKNYQISQYEEPLSEHGYLEIDVNGKRKKIGIVRIHIEEDAGKNIHENVVDGSYVDLNRTGVPLMEIVSEPDINTPEEARAYLTQLKNILLYLEVCDCNMEEGSLRCDANISVRPVGQKEFGTKTEIKNMNSFSNLQKALEYEIERQVDILQDGGRIVQETRLWDPSSGTTASMRSKEEAHDYRYFPCPDLVPVVVDEEWIENIKKTLPELPDEKKQRFVSQYGIPEYDAGVITASKALADYYEKVAAIYNDAKKVSNWVMGELLRLLKEDEKEISDILITPENFASLLQLIDKGTISGKIAKTVFEEMYKNGKTPDEIVEEKGLEQVSDEGEIAGIIDRVLAENTKQVEQYLGGKEKVAGFFVGQVMKATSGKANPGLVNKILKEKLEAMKNK